MVDTSKPVRARDEGLDRQLTVACFPVGNHAERIAEIVEILAVGLTRLWARKSSRISADCGEISLDYAGTQSGHANALKTPGGLD